MANEAVLKGAEPIAINYTCATGTTIEKGAILKNANPMTASLSEGLNDIVAGIAQSEKLAAETSQNSIAVYRSGIFRVTVSGAVSAGDPVTTKGVANLVVKATINDENILGIMLENGTEGQTKLMELRPTTMQLA